MHKRFKEGVLIIFVAFAAFLFLALLTYDPNDPGWAYLGARTDAENAVGVMGAWFASVCLSIFGWLAWFIPCMVGWSGWMLYRERDPNNQINFSLIGMRWLGFILTLVSGVVFASMHVKSFGFPFPDGAGGILGKIISSKLIPVLNHIGTTLLTVALLLGGINLFTSTSWLEIMEWIGDKISHLFAPLGIFLAGLGLFKKTISSKLEKNEKSSEMAEDPISASHMNESLQKSIEHDLHIAEQDEPFIAETENINKAPIIPPKIAPEVDDINDVEFFDVGESKEILDVEQTALNDDNELLMRSINPPDAVQIIIEKPIKEDNVIIEPSIENKPEIEKSEEVTDIQPFLIDNEDEIVEKSLAELETERSNTDKPLFEVETVEEIKTIDNYFQVTDEVITPLEPENEREKPTPIIENIENQEKDNQPVDFDTTIEHIDLVENKHDEPLISAENDHENTDNQEIWQISDQIESVENFSFRNDDEQAKTEEIAEEIPEDIPKIKTIDINQLASVNNEEVIEYIKTGEPQLPDINFLDPAKPSIGGYSEEELEYLTHQVENILNDFKVQVEVVSIQPGPVVTMFELDLAPGIKASKVTGLSTDLARALSKSSVRVVEVIPGKSVIGLEIPNEKRDIVYLREIIESPLFKDTKSVLTVALGKDIVGDPVVADLGKMPHVLIAGTTGSGKSVAINTFILSLLYKATPKDVRLIMIDPKMLELSVYEGIPHLLCPVVTDMEEAANSLRWAVIEMERRYKLMSAMGVRNLEGFNKKIEEAAELGQAIADPIWQPPANATLTELREQPTLEAMPYVVIIIDELADMMMVVGKKVEELIARLAQKARAAGIHLLLATQRPSVDVITGLIKANVPSRIAFKVSSKIDSRTILDKMGAEALLGYGDSLFTSPANNIPMRTHGAFVDDHEVHKVANFLRATGETDYIQDIVKEPTEPIVGLSAEASGVADSESTDPLFDEAVRLVTETGRGSISGIQRRLKIGYNRAARMIEEMEAMGIVSPPENNGNRRVLVSAPPSDD